MHTTSSIRRTAERFAAYGKRIAYRPLKTVGSNRRGANCHKTRDQTRTNRHGGGGRSRLASNTETFREIFMPIHPKFAATLCLLLLPIVATAFDWLDEFEGVYAVGPTTCTVTPIKMAFDVRWAEGAGTQVFFFESATPNGPFIFVSEPKTVGADRFVFYDSRLINGVFIRADETRFPVHKAQPR